MKFTKKFTHCLLFVLVVVTLNDCRPSIAASKSLIAFVRSSPPPSGGNFHAVGDIYTIHADGTALKRLSKSGKCSSPVWTPDGKRIVFVSSGQVWIMNKDGNSKRRIAAPKGWQCKWPSASRDGKRIAFQAERVFKVRVEGVSVPVFDSEEAIWTANLNGKNLKKLVPGNTVFSHAPSQVVFSQKGNELIFVNRNPLEVGEASLRRLNLKTKRQQIIYGAGKQPSYYDLYQPALSPNGKQIACLSWGYRGKEKGTEHNFDDERAGIVIINSNGTAPKMVYRLPKYSSYGGPDWSPDGRQLVFATADSLVALDLKTNKIRNIFKGKGSGAPAWQPR